jgi:CheY-like chemotaxis protein
MRTNTSLKSNKGARKTARILVVEDNPDQWQLIEKAVTICFSEVEPIWFTDQQKAVEFLEDCLLMGGRLPVFVLLDLYMPERQDGWNLLEQLRTRPAPIGHLPIIVLSSSNLAADIAESYDRGTTSYVIKPTDFNQWIEYFQALKEYWWDTVALPDSRSLY